VSTALDWLAGLPAWLVYVVLGVGSALENIVPPVPADTFVVIGGMLASRGAVSPGWAVAIIWVCNVSTALLVYWMGHRHGRGFFERGAGRLLLNEHQLTRIRRFYRRFGLAAIFFARFLPGLRAVVPAFAGVSHQPFLRVAVPVGAASAIWYGMLFWVGMAAGRNLDAVEAWLRDTNRGLLALALVMVAGIAWWWWRTRRAT
jgi:membrane protein DedA with SNARE-associated domain